MIFRARLRTTTMYVCRSMCGESWFCFQDEAEAQEDDYGRGARKPRTPRRSPVCGPTQSSQPPLLHSLSCVHSFFELFPRIPHCVAFGYSTGARCIRERLQLIGRLLLTQVLPFIILLLNRAQQRQCHFSLRSPLNSKMLNHSATLLPKVSLTR